MKTVLVWGDVDSMEDDGAVRALGQSKFFVGFLNSLSYFHYCCRQDIGF